jgi:hypothetical protein
VEGDFNGWVGVTGDKVESEDFGISSNFGIVMVVWHSADTVEGGSKVWQATDSVEGNSIVWQATEWLDGGWSVCDVTEA